MIDEKRIYPNLNKESKFMGIMDYKSLIVLLIYILIVWKLSKFMFVKMLFRFYSIIIFSVPMFGIFYANRNEANIVHVIYTIIRYIFSRKVYAYKITSRKCILK